MGKKKRKSRLETVAENANKEEVEDEANEDLGEEELERGNHSEFEIEGEPQIGAEISHEEAMVKALAYDSLKVKFNDLHEKFLTLSKAVSDMDKEEKQVVNSDSGFSNEEVRRKVF